MRTTATKVRYEQMRAPRLKTADTIGGDQEASFEQSFASLGYTYIRDKAPRLLDYLLGFQLVDRDDEKTKAMGVFGFKVGPQWIYAPVFFLNGQLKGHELMYLKGQDQLVPLKENWVNFVLSQRPQMLGEPDARTLSQIGVMQPNLYRISTPPHSTKFGAVQVDLPSHWRPWAVEFAPCLGSLVMDSPAKLEKYAGLDDRLSLDRVLNESLELCKIAMDACGRYPILAEHLASFYGPDLLRNALTSLRKQAAAAEMVRTNVLLRQPVLATVPMKRAATVLDEPQPVKRAAGPKVEIRVDQDATFTRNAPELTEAERERLKRDGHLIRDARDGEEVSKRYNVQQPMRLVNPDKTGIYDVLVKPHAYARCLIISEPHTSHGRRDFSTIVRLDPRNWLNAHRIFLYVKPQMENEITAYAEWYNGVKNSDMAEGDVYVIVGRNGEGTTPFRVEKSLGGGRYKVSFKSQALVARPRAAPKIEEGPSDWDREFYSGPEMLSLNERQGTRFKSVSNCLYAPQEHKVLKVKRTEEDVLSKKRKEKGNEPTCAPCCFGDTDSQSEDSPILPGNNEDIQMEIFAKTAGLKIYVAGNEVSINSQPLMPKRAALFSLVVQHGFREKEAKEILTEAETLGIHHHHATFRVKYAQPYPNGGNLIEQGPSSPAFDPPPYGADPAYNSHTTQYPDTQFQIVPELNSRNTDPNIYNPLPQYLPPDPMAMQAAQQAGDSGQKEVFDTAMLSGLLRTSRQDNMVQRYLGDLLRALDRLGRLLFSFYWHNEEFAERYGKQELPELEDSLRNTFESLGDVVLYLREKTVNVLPAMGMANPDLAEASEE